MAALVLSPLPTDGATEKWGCKQDTIYSSSTWGFKIVFILLTKVITFHVKLELTPICFQTLNLKELFLWLCKGLSLSLRHLYEHFHEFDEEVFGEERNKRWSRSLWRWKSLSKSLIFLNIESSDWALAGKLILFSSRIGWRVDVKALLSMRSWSHCNGDLIVIFSNRLADLLGMKLLKL